MPEGLRELWGRQGLRQLTVRSAALFIFFLLLPIVTYPILERSRYANGTDPLQFFLRNIYLVDIGASLIFMALAFVLLSRRELIRLKTYSAVGWQRSLFAALSFLSLAFYLYLRYFTSHNSSYVWSSASITAAYSGAIILSLAALLLSTVAAIFPLTFLYDFAMRFRTKLFLALLFFAGYILVTNLLKSLWYLLSTAVATCEFYLLGAVGDASLVISSPNDPLLGINGFIVRVGKDCSGIDSMTMFTGLFLLILAVEWQHIDRKRMFMIFLPGLVGMFAVNVLRIFLLMLVGNWISPEFAVGLFHSNAGWLLFVLYFVVFWWFMLPYVRRAKR